MGFQTQVYGRNAPAIAGDWVSSNPFSTYPAGPGGLVAGASGVTVGRFAWVSQAGKDWDSAPAIVNNSVGVSITSPSGFVHREQQALITAYLAESGSVVPQGLMVNLLTSGDVWVKNAGSGQALFGHKAYASLTDGSVTFAATSSPTTASATASTVSAGTAATATGTISGNVLTTSGAVTNTIYPGAVVTGTNVATGTVIVAQLSGTTGGAGTYAVNIGEQTVASTTLTATPSVLDTTSGTVTGTVAIGGMIASASTGTTGTVVGMAVTAVYAATDGKWVVAPAQGATAVGSNTSATITVQSNIETKWFAVSEGLAGEVVKISSQTLG
jgi:hypothetical protein